MVLVESSTCKEAAGGQNPVKRPIVSTVIIFKGLSSDERAAWFNSLLALRVDANWPTSSPSLTVLQEGRDNPPALALGALFSDRQGENLYLIGGQTSDTPVVTPPETAIWRFDVGRGSWSSPSTSGQTLRRAAEGAAAIVAGAGSDGQPIAIQGFGHVDSHTDPSHSPSTPRNYLSSLTMFDIGSLSLATSGSATSAATGTGNSTARGTPAPRADGTLTYVPGMGTDGKGILVSLGGGTADSLLNNDNLGASALPVLLLYSSDIDGAQMSTTSELKVGRGSRR